MSIINDDRLPAELRKIQSINHGRVEGSIYRSGKDTVRVGTFGGSIHRLFYQDGRVEVVNVPKDLAYLTFFDFMSHGL